MLTEKYRPKRLEDIVGNEEVKKKAKIWILKWLKGEKQKALLIYGKPGVGKTSLAYALANEFNLQLIELSASDFRDKKRIARILEYSSPISLFGRLKLVLIDDIDAMTSKDRGGISELAKVLSNPPLPIIITANDAWDKKLAPIRNEVILLEMKGVSPSQLYSFLKKIAEEENIPISDVELRRIAKMAEGDVRSALNDLESKLFGFRDRKRNIFEVLSYIFKGETLAQIKSAYLSSDVDLETLKLWISQNIPLEFEDYEELAKAFDYLSRADVFDGRIIKRQYWGFLRYSSLLATAGVSLSKKKKYHKFTKYSFPSYLKNMATTASKRAILKSICKKIGKRLHLSPKRVFDDLYFYATLILKTEEESAYFYRLTDEELKYLKSFVKLYK